MKLTPNAKYWHKLWSIRFAILSAFFSAISGAYAVLPEDWLPAIPEHLKAALAFGALASAGASAVSVVVKQQLGGNDDR